MRRIGSSSNSRSLRGLWISLVVALAACGGGGGGGSHTSSVPAISNLQFEPAAVLQFDGNGESAISGTFDFVDQGGDLGQIHLATSQGEVLVESIPGASGVKSGTINGVIIVDTHTIGHYSFEIYLTDTHGNRSNSLTGAFDVKPNDTAARWTERTLPVPTGSKVVLQGLVYTGSQYVAVGDSIFSSPDGVTWTERQSGVSELLRDVTWSGGRFVAVGDGGTILTSSDGASWLPQTIPPLLEPDLRAVAGSGSRYVAVGTQWDPNVSTYADLILTSTDGVSWTPAAQSYSMALYGVTWSGSQFVAVGALLGGMNSEAGVLVSSDGLTWTKYPVGALNFLEEILWNGSQFLATGYTGAVRSTDGIHWTQVGLGSVSGGAIGWSGERFLVCGTIYCQSSTDGVVWTGTATLPGTGPYVRALAWDGTKYVAVGGQAIGTLVLTSP